VAVQREGNDELTERIIGCAIEVHRNLGPGLLESAYLECLCHELHCAGLRFRKEQPMPINYKGIRLDCGYRLDLLVEDKVIVEMKAAEQLVPVFKAQLLTYLRQSGLHVGLLLNFNVRKLSDGIVRMVL
jgi:GxxExxY protein